MPWKPMEIRGELIKKEIDIEPFLTERCRTTRQMIHNVIKNKHCKGDVTYRVRKQISLAVGADFKDIWGVEDHLWYSKFL